MAPFPPRAVPSRGRVGDGDGEGGAGEIDAFLMMWNIPSESKQEMERRNGKKKWEEEMERIKAA